MINERQVSSKQRATGISTGECWVVLLVVGMVFAGCGGEESVASTTAATKEDIGGFCEAKCKRKEQCGDAPIGCWSSCQEKSRWGAGRMRRSYLEALRRCERCDGLGCDPVDASHPGYQGRQLFKDCLSQAKRCQEPVTACFTAAIKRGELDEAERCKEQSGPPAESCLLAMVLVPELEASVQQCLARDLDCPAMRACVHEALTGEPEPLK